MRNETDLCVAFFILDFERTKVLIDYLPNNFVVLHAFYLENDVRNAFLQGHKNILSKAQLPINKKIIPVQHATSRGLEKRATIAMTSIAVIFQTLFLLLLLPSCHTSEGKKQTDPILDLRVGPQL